MIHQLHANVSVRLTEPPRMAGLLDKEAPGAREHGLQKKQGDSLKLEGGLQSQFCALYTSASSGQCWNGSCSYPMSLNQCIWSLRANSAAPMLCTGASPHRYTRHEHKSAGDGRQAHLVVEPALGLEMVEELAIRLAAPEVHVRDLEIAPDCARAGAMRARSAHDRRERETPDAQ